MDKTNTGHLRLIYNDGTEQIFEYVREEDVSNIAGRIQEGLSQSLFLIELEDKLLAVPVSSLKNIEVTPPPPRLPKFAIHFAKLV